MKLFIEKFNQLFEDYDSDVITMINNGMLELDETFVLLYLTKLTKLQLTIPEEGNKVYDDNDKVIGFCYATPYNYLLIGIDKNLNYYFFLECNTDLYFFIDIEQNTYNVCDHNDNFIEFANKVSRNVRSYSFDNILNIYKDAMNDRPDLF